MNQQGRQNAKKESEGVEGMHKRILTMEQSLQNNHFNICTCKNSESRFYSMARAKSGLCDPVFELKPEP